MTQERKDELYELMIAWICEHNPKDEDLFLVLTEQFGMTQAELHDHCIESLDYFFTDSEAEEFEQDDEEFRTEPVQTIGMELTEFISNVSEMVSGDDKTAVLNWIEFAGFMLEGADEGTSTLEKELLELYLPICYVKNNFSDMVLQQSLNTETLGNEIIFGAMLFAAGYSEVDVRNLGNEGAIVDGYIPIEADEKGSLAVVAIAGRNDCLFIANNLESSTTFACVKRAAILAERQGRDIASVLEYPQTSGMPLRMITDERLIDAVKISCTASSAFDHITVYDQATGTIAQSRTEGLTTEQRETLFGCGSGEQNEGMIQHM